MVERSLSDVEMPIRMGMSDACCLFYNYKMLKKMKAVAKKNNKWKARYHACQERKNKKKLFDGEKLTVEHLRELELWVKKQRALYHFEIKEG